MIRAAICDDEPHMIETMKKVVCDVFEKEHFPCKVSCFTNGIALLHSHAKIPFDILFLDVIMPEQNGFDVAKIIRKQSDKTVILFVTSQDELVYESFNYRPFYFLRKGDAAVFSDSFSNVVRKVTSYINRNKMITLDMGVGEKKLVSMQDIDYLESDSHYVLYYITKNEICRVRESLSDAETLLKEYGFIQVHKRFIVNIYKVQNINLSRYPSVKLYSGKDLPIGRKYKDSVLKSYKEQLRNKL